VRARPDSHTASDLAAPNSLPKSFGEHHKKEFTVGGSEFDVVLVALRFNWLQVCETQEQCALYGEVADDK